MADSGFDHMQSIQAIYTHRVALQRNSNAYRCWIKSITGIQNKNYVLPFITKYN